MDNIEKNMIHMILREFKIRLDRDISKNEVKILSQNRSYFAHEMILDYIKDEQLSKKEIEVYLSNLS